jgi:hypothetical protein
MLPPARDYMVSDNEITLVRPERDTMPPIVERWEDQEPTTETVRALPAVPGGFFDFVQQYSGQPSQTKPMLLTRPSPPPPDARPMVAPPPPPLPEPRVAAAPPPPPPPEPRPRAPRTTDLPPAYAAPPLELQPTLRPPVAPAAAHQLPPRHVPSSLPPPVAIESLRETSRRQAQAAAARPWLSMFTIGPLSALVAALVSSALWSYHTRDLQASSLIPEGKTASADAAHLPQCAPRTGGSDSTGSDSGAKPMVAEGSSPASLSTALQAPPGVTPQVSIDSLPTVGGGAKAALFGSVAVAEPAAQPAPRARSSRVRETRPVDLSSSQSAQSESSESGESESTAAPAPAAPKLPQGADRGAVTKAMSRASRTAASCGAGPQDGRVSLTISPAGVVTSVSLVKGFGDAGVNACVLRAFSRAKIPAYEGDPIQVRKGVRW